MIQLRKSSERGFTQKNWLQSYHTFSFGDYDDPAFMSFGHLRVINEDIVQPDSGFRTHPHRNMEIITYIVEGALEHKDSLGTGSIIKPGEIQRMSAGTGITHSEFNPSLTEPVHLLQIWILPQENNLSPSYEQKTILKKENELVLIAGPQPTPNTVKIHQDVNLYRAHFLQGFSLQYAFSKGRQGWIQVVQGILKINEVVLSAGDGAALIDEEKIKLNSPEDCEFLLFDISKSNSS